MKRRTAIAAGGLIAGAVVLGGAGAVLAGSAAGVFGYSASACSPGYSATMSEYRATDTMGAAGFGGMMGGGASGGRWSNCYPSGMLGGATGNNPRGTTLTLAQAQQRVRQYIAQYGTTSLAVDEVMEFQNNFYAIVKDRSTGHGAFEVLVNKATGAVFPEYGPAMMWNTQYGAMGGMMGYQQPSGPMAITPAQATRIATQWLQQNQSGNTTEAPEQFPGYYTVHILKHGNVAGMLSVNGYSGQVWYHSWHGALLRMTDLHA